MATPTNRAWRTKWGGVESIVAAPTAGKARLMTVRAAREVYTDAQVKFTAVWVQRAACFDAWAATDTSARPWSELAVRREMEWVKS